MGLLAAGLNLVSDNFIQQRGDRYVAGYNLQQGLDVISALVDMGYSASFDILGEDADSVDSANSAMFAYCGAIDEIAKRFTFGNHPHNKPVSVSVKPSAICYVHQSGIINPKTSKGTEIAFDPNTSLDERLKDISAIADEKSVDVTLDMEDHRYTDLSLDAADSVWYQGYQNLGLVLQSSLDRTLGDIVKLGDLSSEYHSPWNFRVRACRGIYTEPTDISVGRKEAKKRLVQDIRDLFDAGAYVEIATHDKAVIKELQEGVLRDVPREQYEFQFLLGVPVAENFLAPMLRDVGHVVRFYTPVQLIDGAGIKYMRRRLIENWLMMFQGATTFGRKSLAKDIREDIRLAA